MMYSNPLLTLKTAASFSLLTICLMLLNGCEQPPTYGYIEGETMGTSYHIRYRQPDGPDGVDKKVVQQAVDARLIAINNSMSTYQDDSTISKFNRLAAGESLVIDADFEQVLRDARQVYQQSGGAFDPTVMPLVNLWGFGRVMTVDRLQKPPSSEAISAAKALIDFDSVVLTKATGTKTKPTLSKTKEGVALDFSAIAKGYGVDAIANVLHDTYQINHYMVEIGGEVATSGLNPSSQPWQIAIDAPVFDSEVSDRDIITVIRQPTHATPPNLPNQLHLATSGNYRNSLVFNGKRYSHTIDPTTGQPIVGGAPSVSVVANTVSLADAWATALTAMPYSKALKVATEHHIAALFVIPANGDLSDRVDADTNTLGNSEANAQANTQANGNANKPLWKVVQTPAMQALRRDDANIDADIKNINDKQ